MKQIEINYLTSTGYESLYPNVNCASITDFAKNLYSKSEVDERIQEFRNQTGDLKFAMGQYTGTEDINSLRPEVGMIVVGSWSVITVGFTPERIILFINGMDANLLGEGVNIGNFFSLPYIAFGRYNLIEVRTNGFAVRNAASRGSSLFDAYYFNRNDIPIYYFAFG